MEKSTFDKEMKPNGQGGAATGELEDKQLVAPGGGIRYGVYDEPPGTINYRDYPLKSPMGFAVPSAIRRFLFNQFFFVGICCADFAFGLAVVDLKFVTNGFVYLFDRRSGELVEEKRIALPGRNRFIDPDPRKGLCRFKVPGLCLEMDGGTVRVRGKRITLTAELDLAATAPLRLCSRSGYRGWTYTEKTAPVRISGEVGLDGVKRAIASPDAMALLDWTGGFMRRETFWNWAAIATVLPDGRSLGLNLSCGVNETGFTENGFWIDGAFTPVDTVNFAYDAHKLFKPWRITSRDGRVDLTFTPEGDRSERINVLLAASRFTQLFGNFQGTLKGLDGTMVKLRKCFGWTEDHYAKW